VLVLELMNSIFERMVDILKPRIHHYVEDIKDIMAGTVLVASLGSALIGLLIFWPYIVRMVAGTQ
jgi:diacylglycerol kinase